MIKIDLITGFLGAGKTTFLKKYAGYWLSQGEKVCILENDYGAVNVDMMLLQELTDAGCDAEMVAGGCDMDCHRRRFRTKLIAMGMSGYDRVIVEPSGIYDTDEFFDALREDPLDRWYEIGSVIAVADASEADEWDEDSQYILASEVANAGVVIYSHTGGLSEDDLAGMTDRINKALSAIGADRQIGSEEIISKDWALLTGEDYENISCRGYRLSDYKKRQIMDDNSFETLYFMENDYNAIGLEEAIKTLMSDSSYGRIIRIKGFYQDDGGWYEINATKRGITVSHLTAGQKVVIVIGEELDKKRIGDRLDF
ncbi:MAG: GTPase (G3E family) [Lachnospiraceae bacterium]|nr:GTPase (G3E family) [Lachnospiraceae bacterium]